MKWFRFYSDALNNYKVQALTGDLFKSWVNILCLASQGDGKLPSVEEIAFHFKVTKESVTCDVEALVKAGLIDVTKSGLIPHNWKKRQFVSDGSANRMRELRKRTAVRHRDGSRDVTRDGAVTPSDTEAEAEAEAEAENTHTEALVGSADPPVCVPSPPEPEPERTPYIPPVRRSIALDGKTVPSGRFDEFWARWPNKIDRVPAERAWCDLVSDDNSPMVFECLSAFEASDEWARGVYGRAHNWLYARARNEWADRPAPARSTAKKTGIEEILDRYRKEGKIAS